MLLSLFRYLAERDAQGIGHPLAVCRISLQAVADITDLDLPGAPPTERAVFPKRAFCRAGLIRRRSKPGCVRPD